MTIPVFREERIGTVEVGPDGTESIEYGFLQTVTRYFDTRSKGRLTHVPPNEGERFVLHIQGDERYTVEVRHEVDSSTAGTEV